MSNDSYTPMGVSSTFTVVADPDNAPLVYTQPTCVGPDAVGLDVFYENVASPPNGAWIGIWPEGADRYDFSLSWSYVPSGSSDGEGFFWFSGTIGDNETYPLGRYEVRVLNSFRRIWHTAYFDVSDGCPTPTVDRNRDFYQVGDIITASWATLESNPDYAVGLIDVLEDPATGNYLEATGTSSNPAGDAFFTAPSPGKYQINAFHQYALSVVAESESFIVCPDGQVPDCLEVCRDETLIRPFECLDTGPPRGDSGSVDSGATGDSGGGGGGDSGMFGDSGGSIGDSGASGGDSGGGDSGGSGDSGLGPV
jgi:hypothetical protein